jgi:hypothetical protein
MNAVSNSSSHQAGQLRWLVEFTHFKVQNEQQRRVIDSLDKGVLGRVIEVFLDAVTPGAFVVEPANAPTKTIVFSSRRAGRRFIATFGGRWVRHLGK